MPDDGSPPPAAGSVRPPIVDPELVVLQEGRVEPVVFEGEPSFAELRALGPTRPEGASDERDVLIEVAFPASWLESGGFGLCAWTASQAFAPGCVSSEVLSPDVPWRFGTSTTGDDRFELWFTDGDQWGRRLIALDPSGLDPGVHTARFVGGTPTIAEFLTEPPRSLGDYLELEQ